MKNKLLMLVGLATLIFVLFLIRVFFGAPVLLIVVMLLVIALGLAYRRYPERFQALFPPKAPPAAPINPDPANAPLRHEKEKKTYLVLTSVHASSRKSIIVDQPHFVIGRNRGCNHVIGNDEVSGRHLQIDYHDSEKLCYVTDLHSTNGTLLNGADVRGGESRALSQGDMLQIANEIYQVEYAHF